jgi:hypothetical protein
MAEVVEPLPQPQALSSNPTISKMIIIISIEPCCGIKSLGK